MSPTCEAAKRTQTIQSPISLKCEGLGVRAIQASRSTMRAVLSAMLLIPLALSGCTPPPPTQAIKWTFGGDGDDVAVAVRESSDGGYIVAGTTRDYDNDRSAIVVLKIDSSGRQVWGRTFQGDRYNEATTLLRLPGDKFVVIGTTDVYNGGPDPDDYTSYDSHAYGVCVDGNGTTQWEKTYGPESPTSAAVTAQGDLVVGGDSRSRTLDGMYLSRISAEGELLWIKAVGDESAFIYTLRTTSDGNIIFLGSLEDKAFLAKADGEGNLLWQRSDFNDGPAYFFDLIETSQGDYVLLGQSVDIYSPFAILVKTDSNGNTLWKRNPNTRPFFTTLVGVLAEASDGGYIIAGDYAAYGKLVPNGEVVGMYFAKTNVDGRELWSYVYTRNDRSPNVNFVEVAEDGGYILAGDDGGILDETGESSDNYDMAIVKTDVNGNIE